MGSTALVVALFVCAASPLLHSKLHGDDTHAAEDQCAVVLFASGVSFDSGLLAVAAPSPSFSAPCAEFGGEIFVAPPRHLRQPERGPPGQA